MKKMIKISDFLTSPMAVSTDKAELIFLECKKIIEAGDIVEIDFKDVKLVITAFLNIAIGKLYGLQIDSEIIDSSVNVVNATQSIQKMIEKVINNSKKFYSNKELGKINNDYLNKSIDGDI